MRQLAMPRIWQIDAFASQPFTGNPAAVCLLEAPAEAAWMQRVAAEMNLSETAFLCPRQDAGQDARQDDGYDLRWFTPTVEVALCGHATLASAHALWEGGDLSADVQARFHTPSGLLTAARRGDWIELNFPALSHEPAPAPPGLIDALGAPAVYVGKSRFDYLVEVDSEAVVRALTPDHARLRQLPVRGIMVTATSNSAEFDFVSRFFAPGSGINEDPVTGSAHCCLTPYWAAKLGKTSLSAYQASARGGRLRLRLAGDRVQLAGQACTVLRGTLTA